MFTYCVRWGEGITCNYDLYWVFITRRPVAFTSKKPTIKGAFLMCDALFFRNLNKHFFKKIKKKSCNRYYKLLSDDILLPEVYPTSLCSTTHPERLLRHRGKQGHCFRPKKERLPWNYIILLIFARIILLVFRGSGKDQAGTRWRRGRV